MASNVYSMPAVQGYNGASAQPNPYSQQQGSETAQAYQQQQQDVGAGAGGPNPYGDPKKKKPGEPDGAPGGAMTNGSEGPPPSQPAAGGGTPPSPVASNGTIPPQGSVAPINFASKSEPAPQPQAQPGAMTNANLFSAPLAQQPPQQPQATNNLAGPAPWEGGGQNLGPGAGGAAPPVGQDLFGAGGTTVGPQNPPPYYDPRPVDPRVPAGPGAGGPNPPTFDPRQTDPRQPQQAGGVDPFAAMGGGTFNPATGGWVPNNNPAALSAAGLSPTTIHPGDNPAAGGGAAAGGWQSQPWQTAGSVGQPGARADIYNPTAVGVGDLGHDAITSYQGGQVGQFTPAALQNQAQQQALMASLLQNPDAVSPQMQAQLKGRMQDEATQMAMQQRQMYGVNAAARGVSGGGGTLANDRRVDDSVRSQILGGNRDIDLAAGQANFNSRMGVAGLSDQLLNSETNRGTQNYQTGLQGQMAQQSLNQAQASSGQNAQQMAIQRALGQAGLQQNADQLNNNFGFQRSQMQQAGHDTDLSAYLQGRGQDMSGYLNYRGQDLDNANQGANRDLQRYLGDQGFGLDRARLGEQGRQFNMGNDLNWASLLNNMTMDRGQLGLGYANLQQNAQNSMFSKLFGGG